MIDEGFVPNLRIAVCHMFLGHAPNHAPDVFRFLNLTTKHVIVSWNVIWLNKVYGDWKNLQPAEIEYVTDEEDDAPDPGREEEAEESDGRNDGEIEEEVEDDGDRENRIDEEAEEAETPNQEPQIIAQPPPPITKINERNEKIGTFL
jgi:hypothetical protein